MAVVEWIVPADALAARRSLQAQIARLEGELATILAGSYPPIAPPPPRRAAHARPHLLGLGELERSRDDLAARVSAADNALAIQQARQSRARALLADMLEDPPAHKGTRVTNADLGLPGCATYRVLPRLGPVGVLTGWWRVKVSSGCPLPSAANVSRRNRKRRPRPRTTAPPVPPRAPKRARPRIEDRPKAPWHPFPLIEVAVFVGIVLIVVGLITRDSRRGRALLLLGLALGSLGGLDTTLREHFAGYRSHTLVLALAPAVTLAVLLAVAGAPLVVIPVVAVAAFGAAFALLRGAWRRAGA
jgi:hypothetical protein